jgi:hypothetical protein
MLKIKQYELQFLSLFCNFIIETDSFFMYI